MSRRNTLRFLSHVDEFDRPVYDVTAQARDAFGSDCIRAEQCEKNVLALFPRGRDFTLLYVWLRDADDLSSVLGAEQYRYAADEVTPQALFFQFSLVP